VEARNSERVTVRARIENLGDLCLVERQLLTPKQARSVEVDDAIVSTGATLLFMPKYLIERLELQPSGTRTALTSAGPVTVRIYEAVRLTIQDRDCTAEVSELPDDGPVLVGWIPLGQLDLIVDVPGQKLIGNPAHGGEPMIEMYHYLDDEYPDIACAASIGEC
jgi:predicted aspartyl protease